MGAMVESRNNPSEKKADTLRIGGDFGSIRGGVGKTCSSVATIVE
jgi:hypothetical protein